MKDSMFHHSILVSWLLCIYFTITNATSFDPVTLPHVREARRILELKHPKSATDSDVEQILLETTAPFSIVDPQFLSVTIDAGDIGRNWSGITFTAQRIINMARALVPAMLRVGGTAEDFVYFNTSTIKESNITMTVKQWDAVNEFVEIVGWDFIFGLNAFLRTPYPNGTWDSNNARLLMSYSNSKNYTVQWELGNEPDLWDKFNVTLSPEEHAKDYLSLRELVAELKPPGTMIVGPDVASSKDYFAKFIESLPQQLLSATTYHQYYGNGHTGTLPEFYDVDLLDSFIHTAVFFQSATELSQPNSDVWLGETSSLYDGGTPHLSNSYVAGFMWLDKLGIAALAGHKRVFRQTFVGGAYSLLDSNQNPLPDYWLSVLHKKLVGTRVLYVNGSLVYGRHLRVYAHCAKSPYPMGSVVLIVLNMNFYVATADLLNEDLVSSERDVFWLSPPGGNLTSTSVQLNGVTLELVKNTELPNFKPDEQQPGGRLILPSISFGFIVFKNAKLNACL